MQTVAKMPKDKAKVKGTSLKRTPKQISRLLITFWTTKSRSKVILRAISTEIKTILKKMKKAGVIKAIYLGHPTKRQAPPSTPRLRASLINTSSKVALLMPQSRIVSCDLARSTAAKTEPMETSEVGSSYRCVPAKEYVCTAADDKLRANLSAATISGPGGVVIVNTCADERALNSYTQLLFSSQREDSTPTQTRELSGVRSRRKSATTANINASPETERQSCQQL